MREFDLSAALAGAPVCTRDGRPVTQLTVFNCSEKYSIAGVVSQLIYMWDEDGNPCHISTNEDRRLCMAPVKKTGWVARYKEGGVCGTFATEEQARATCGNRTVTYHKIEWEE